MNFLDKTSLATGYFPNKASSTRAVNDFFPTPPIATLSLLKNHKVPKRIWEICAGKGHISAELIRNGHEVYSSDLYPYENNLVDVDFGIDFLEAKRQDVDGVITNPPFKNNLPEKLVYRMIKEFKYDFVAILSRITFLESARRYKLFTELPPSRILVFSERINCNEDYYKINHGIGGMICYSFLIWDKNYPHTNRIDWVKPSDYINDL